MPGSLPSVAHGCAAVQGGEIHFAHAGQGPALILMHGGHGSWTHWIANVEALSEKHRIIAPDFPGFGESFRPAGAYTLEDYRDRMVEMMDALGVVRACLIGFSFGGMVATAVAAAFPQRASGLVVVNAPGTGKPSPEAIAILNEQSGIAKREGVRQGLRGTLERIMLADASLIDDGVRALTLANIKRTRVVTRPISRNVRIVPLMEQLACPSLVLLGAQDPHQRHELEARTARIAAALKDGMVEVWPDAAHWLQYECADRFNNRVLAFLERLNFE